MIADIRINNLEKETLTEDELNLRFDLSWSPPKTANGVLTKYEVMLGTEPHPNSTLYQRTLPVSMCVQDRIFPVHMYMYMELQE